MAVELNGAALRRKLTSVYKQDLVAGDALHDLSEVLASALYAEWEQALDDLRTFTLRKTAPGVWLDKWLEAYGIKRPSGESDAQARIRLAARIWETWGAITADEMLTLVSNCLDTDILNVTYEENIGDDGLFEPNRINLFVPSDAFPSGVTIGTVSDLLLQALDRGAAGGIKVTLTVTSGATYDGGFLYDDPDTVYGGGQP